MNTLADEIRAPEALNVSLTDDTLSVDLNDERRISVVVAWFPRLLHSSEEERNNWRLSGKGQGIHWEDIDEDISIEGRLAGKPSSESQESFKKWVDDFTPQSIEFWALIFMTEPLRQIIIYINNPHTIENMARWFEFPWNF